MTQTIPTLPNPPDAPDAPPQTGYSVQEASEQAGISAHTLRYYERAGLLSPVFRVGTGNHRRYNAEDLRRIEFLKRMRATGMPIHRIRHFIGLVGGGETTMEERICLLETHRDQIRDQIAEFQEHLSVLDYKITNYRQLALETQENDTPPLADCRHAPELPAHAERYLTAKQGKP